MLDQPFFVPAALLLVASLPLVLGVVPRNRWYGVRTRLTLSRDESDPGPAVHGDPQVSLSAVGYLAYAHRSPAAPGTVDLFHPHTYVFLVPLVLTALVTWGVGLRLGRR